MFMLNTAMRSTQKMPWKISMEDSSMERKLAQFFHLWQTFSMPNVNSTLMEVAKEEVIATICTWNPSLKVSKRNFSKQCIWSIPNIEPRRDLKVRTLLRGEESREEEKERTRRVRRKDLLLLLIKNLIKNIRTKIDLDRGQGLQAEIVHKKEEISLQSGTKDWISDSIWSMLNDKIILLININSVASDWRIYFVYIVFRA